MVEAEFILAGKASVTGSGALGTELRVLAGAMPVEYLNLTHPEAVERLHRAYIAAGAQVIVANTFAANRLTLCAAGIDAEGVAINRAGIQIAHCAAEGRIPVWGSVGPLELGLQLPDYDDQELEACYAEQCKALREADALILETFRDLREAETALGAAAKTGLPLILQMSVDSDDRLSLFVRLGEQFQVRALGVNCVHPGVALRQIQRLRRMTDLPLTVWPNAGAPFVLRNEIRYALTPEELARTGVELIRAGASLVGGCCGTTPGHIQALHEAVRELVVLSATHEPATVYTVAEVELPAVEENQVRRLMKTERFLISTEIRADRRRTLPEIVEQAHVLAGAGTDLIDVPENPGAHVGRDAVVTAAAIQAQVAVPCIPHFPVIQSNLLKIHSSLIGCWDTGLRGLLAVTGDAPASGPLARQAHRVSDLKSSVELLRLLEKLRGGRLLTEEPLADPPDFCAGCTVSDYTPPHQEWLKKKRAAGAEYVFSQPVFDGETLEQLLDAAEAVGLRAFPGLFPLTGKRTLHFLEQGRLPGVVLPGSVQARFEKVAPEDQRRAGLDHAKELADVIARRARGIYLIMPFGPEGLEDTIDLIRHVRSLI